MSAYGTWWSFPPRRHLSTIGPKRTTIGLDPSAFVRLISDLVLAALLRCVDIWEIMKPEGLSAQGLGVSYLGTNRRVNWQRLSPGSAEAYIFATFLVVIASLIRWGLGLVADDIQIFTTYYPAVLLAALLGGAGVGAFASLLGALVAWWAFLPPYFAFQALTAGQQINLASYVFASLLIVWAAEHYRRLTKRLEDQENFRKLTVEELAHRLKNKLATIQSIISFQLREEPQVRSAILNRLNALSATDDLIMAAQGQGARIRDILTAELAPYGSSRVSIEGPVCLLSPKLALTMALLVHELATNAAKYGALSNAVGKLAIDWKLSDGRLNVDWREYDGPIITKPTHQGFGTRLLSRSLDQFEGTVEIAFETTGLVCKMRVNLPEHTPSIVPDAINKGPGILAAD